MSRGTREAHWKRRRMARVLSAVSAIGVGGGTAGWDEENRRRGQCGL